MLGGLSLGGFLSLEFCLQHPHRVDAVMLFDTGPGYRRDEPRQQWNARAFSPRTGWTVTGGMALGGSAEADYGHRAARAGWPWPRAAS